MAGCELNGSLYVIGGAGDDNAEGLNLILAGVGAVEHAAVAVEAHLAFDNLLQLMDQLLRLLYGSTKGG